MSALPAKEKGRHHRQPLTQARLSQMAELYVGRFQTSRGRLLRYLRQKIRDYGWAEGEDTADLEAIADDFVRLGFVNDQLFAESRARSFARKGLGERRLQQALNADGLAKTIIEETTAELDAWALALHFARRKKLGPFAVQPPEPSQKQKQLAALIRAGHPPRLAQRILNASTPEELDPGD